MECRGFHELLQGFLEETLPADDRRSAEEHLAACAGCRELCTLMRLDPESLSAEAPPDLARSVLERTSGSPCGRAREIVCELVDEELEGLDAELLLLHLRDCRECDGLAGVLARLAEDLPAMATLTPDARFVDDVVAATASTGIGRVRRGARWVHGWTRLLERPRIAWEAAYVCSMVLWLVLGANLHQLSAAPALAVTALKTEPPVMLEEVGDDLSSWKHRTIEAGSERLVPLGALGSDVRRRYRAAGGATENLRRHGVELKDAALELDLRRTGEVLKTVGDEARTLWARWVADHQENGETK